MTRSGGEKHTKIFGSEARDQSNTLWEAMGISPQTSKSAAALLPRQSKLVWDYGLCQSAGRRSRAAFSPVFSADSTWGKLAIGELLLQHQ